MIDEVPSPPEPGPAARPGRATILRRLRTAALPLAAIGLIAYVARSLHELQPVQTWMAWRYLSIWLLDVGLMAACLSFGQWFLRRALRLSLPFTEHMAVGLAVGVLAFAIGIFLLGILHLLGGWTFWAWPLALAAPGARSLGRACRRGAPRIGRTMMNARGWALLLVAFATAALIAVYLPVLSPLNISYDSRWYHTGIAEQYAVRGAIERFPEGFFNGTQPELATYLYTWGFLCPWGHAWYRMTLVYHLEFMLFAATLAALPLGVRWLAGKRAPWASWGAFFLFPGIFLYDSMLCLGADHVLAFWATPVLLAFRRVLRAPDRRGYALLALLTGAAALTRIQGIYLVAGPTLILLLAAARAAIRRAERPRARAHLSGLLVFAGLFVVVLSPHWLKNLIWHGDPYYPLLRNVVRVRPYLPNIDPLRDAFFTLRDTPRDQAIRETTKEVLALGLTSSDWPTFHHAWPVFFVFFPLGVLVALPAMGRRGYRGALVLAMTALAVLIWYVTFHQDRYLGAVVPWMTAVTAAALWRAWQAGRWWRVYVVVTLAMQLVWAGDYVAFSNHPLNGVQNPIAISLTALSSTFNGKDLTHQELDQGLADLGNAIPRTGRLLMHENDMRLGIRRATITDERNVQGAIDYSVQRSPAWVGWMLRKLGVTHLAWRPQQSLGGDHYADDLVFYDFVARLPGPGYGLVYVVDCDVRGPWRVVDLDAGMAGRVPPSRQPLSPGEVNFAVIKNGCDANRAPVNVNELLANRGEWRLFRATPR